MSLISECVHACGGPSLGPSVCPARLQHFVLEPRRLGAFPAVTFHPRQLCVTFNLGEADHLLVVHPGPQLLSSLLLFCLLCLRPKAAAFPVFSVLAGEGPVMALFDQLHTGCSRREDVDLSQPFTLSRLTSLVSASAPGRVSVPVQVAQAWPGSPGVTVGPW